ncbi:hypothetical protein D9M71_803800 [compost metagenome]
MKLKSRVFYIRQKSGPHDGDLSAIKVILVCELNLLCLLKLKFVLSGFGLRGGLYA